ncbi:hypothetical protein [Lentzea sp. NPDC092896]|uniref:hypothetical protein n=1 Tax=Lentzea sp. NPDC092896 TaxID=3364127 RepID=UPI003821EED8
MDRRILVSVLSLVAAVLVIPAHSAVASEEGPEVCAKHAQKAGFRGEDLVEAVAIGMAESRCRTYFDDPVPADQGMWQIKVDRNDPWRNGTNGNLLDPAYNAVVTNRMSSGGTNWTAWTTYNNGTYRRYLDVARDAANNFTASRHSADFNGNGSSDYAVYRPSDGSFHVLFDSGGLYEPSWRLGHAGDLPVAGDWNGNGNSDYAVYRPSDGSFHVLFDSGGLYEPTWRLGGPGYVPVAGDWNGNGNSDYGVYNPADGSFHVLFDSGGLYEPSWRLGGPGDLPVAGDFNGNGTSDYAVYRPADGSFHVLFDSGGAAYHPEWRLGGPGFLPVSGDWNGNGNSDYGVYNPADGSFHVLFDSGGLYQPSWRLGGPDHRPL